MTQISMDETNHRPIAMNYLVIPHVPRGRGTLLSAAGEPVMVDYSQLDWRSLAQALKARIDDDGYPKNIKVYVANDGPDLFDINETIVATGEELEQGPFFVERTRQSLNQATPASYRAGVIDLSPAGGSMHLNPPDHNSLRPPLAAFVVSIRFNTPSQAADYYFTLTEMLFGVGLPMEFGPVRHGDDEPMCDALRAWLAQSMGVVYAPECSIVLLGAQPF